MKTTPLTPADLRASVLAVPPLARRPDGTPDDAGNRRLLAHLRSGGITTYMYGGNANFYNLGVAEFGRVLDTLTPLLEASDWLIPSIGADFGKAAEQIALLRERAFPTAMVLPLRFPATPAGVASGIGKLAERYGRPVIAYVKDEGYIRNEDLAALVKDGSVCAVKYAIVRDDPREDAVLRDLIACIGTDPLISGIGERPVIDHFRTFGLRAFTSGSCCVAPALSNGIRVALHDGRFDDAAALREHFVPLENARDAWSPIRVLHAAVAAAGIANTGPIGEFLSTIDDPRTLADIEKAATQLVALNADALA
ncbi:Dihydrodipicolinate synthase/N-acetylneuraminate lyase [Paraburkholderia caballeronis]|uniref:Dihydrodipicolinate synthase/N-acetylneuraminate lyase n=1 Tax=Paraburkholderia caballeronis TaxID=416943 RepID=A0A1H7S4G7_9BURK|nr:dihydrodipicolinate synthase/N-acetylneuraminate lyase [Paraburkholderia caballeronis]PXW97262.1 dihydrodipicolinate synthase/N-acetylneuraminate lyase [Paraburkholderia caballeronis]RAJ93782.1 dihydrodipicolinate synthase/N-acetylneuraminate lyase [Paraburkholderia caballeronis]SED58884.1 Dihydrodipicolinate synthase/N-acetylneuraminate lyase [Paraburkholderia caballeronis]SEL67413.1 Dihydrodipicolinate synthase/N-acetylneuraminate lyase [Paraburkholderia caballeronis]